MAVALLSSKKHIALTSTSISVGLTFWLMAVTTSAKVLPVGEVARFAFVVWSSSLLLPELCCYCWTFFVCGILLFYALLITVFSPVPSSTWGREKPTLAKELTHPIYKQKMNKQILLLYSNNSNKNNQYRYLKYE